MPSRKKGTIALVITNYTSLAIVIVKGIMLVPLYLYYIDDRLYGAWLATGSIVAYFGLLDLGLNGVLVQRVASTYGKGDISRLGSILGTGLIIGLCLSCLPVFLAFLISPWITGIVKVTGVESGQLRLAFIIAGVGTSLMLAMYCMGGMLTALQRQVVHGVVLVVGNILGVVATLILLINGYGLLSIPAGTLVWAIVSALGDGLYLWWFVRKKLPQVCVRFKKEEIRDLSLQSVWQFCSRSASTTARESDNLIVAALLDPRLCTVLTLTKRASDMLAMLVRHFAGAFLPSLAHLHGEDDRGKFKRIVFLLFKITSLFGVCFMGSCLFLNENFVGLWVGSKFFGGYMLTALFCSYGFFFIFASIFYNVIFAKGEMITVARTNIAEALIRVPLCIVLVMLWGIKGAAMSAVLAIIPTTFWMQARRFVKVLNLSKYEIINSVKIIVLQVVVALIVGIIFNSIWKPEGIFEFISFGGLYMLTVFSICLFLDTELRSKILDIQKRLFNRYLVKEIK
ncbi:MAG: oligosaccharide flippase family protein [Candidatus Scalindua sediminis]|nr:oligosaccharide flippase family protein [Candidatus Scalindua sediminis]